MSRLHIRRPTDAGALADWRHVHNEIIPTHLLSAEDVRDRAGRHHLSVAYADDVLVGSSTVRPPTDGTDTATVIARVLPAHRGRGYGEELYVHGLARARELGAETIETVVLSTNLTGLRFAERHGFVETERYVLPGETVPWIDLRLTR
ncbi:GNAT family N-acetyltransferase [Streptomyces sp. CRN 30]|uniref:GNAT family N-acetyltransferase n=1 Tax=Streptomyces sp. CRN 30 TaxID=3075613 RepID=UPI002A7FC0A2|nr:GNAT family N-acetyltransferase [Streptomyces sp. CRN 30]